MINIINLVLKFLTDNIGLVTLVVGGYALFIYIKQKVDYRRDAANIILMEIRSAEAVISHIKSTGILNLNYQILPSNSWYKYNYLFIKKLDKDEIDILNNFYNQCELLDKMLCQVNSLPQQLKDKGCHIQKYLTNIAKEALSEADYNIKRTLFLEIVNKEKYWFEPEAPKEAIRNTLNNINFITTTTSGQKLKKIARIKN